MSTDIDVVVEVVSLEQVDRVAGYNDPDFVLVKASTLDGAILWGYPDMPDGTIRRDIEVAWYTSPEEAPRIGDYYELTCVATGRRRESYPGPARRVATE